MKIRESFVNATRGHRLGDSPWSNTFTEDRGTLYRALVREYGRCIGRIYVDQRVPVATDPTLPAYTLDAEPVGWVFVKRVRYDDAPTTFLREVWVEVARA